MKKGLIGLLVFLFVVAGITVFWMKVKEEKVDSDKLLFDVMNSKEKFTDEENNEVLFKDYKIAGKTTSVDKYTYVDLDKDEISELVVYTASDYGAYLIFRYDNNNNKVYGYMMDVRAFENLKKDGSFTGSNGALSNEYNEIKFNNNVKTIINKANYDETSEKYTIDGKTVTKEEIDQYVESWNKKESIKWTK